MGTPRPPKKQKHPQTPKNSKTKTKNWKPKRYNEYRKTKYIYIYIINKKRGRAAPCNLLTYSGLAPPQVILSDTLYPGKTPQCDVEGLPPTACRTRLSARPLEAPSIGFRGSRTDRSVWGARPAFFFPGIYFISWVWCLFLIFLRVFIMYVNSTRPVWKLLYNIGCHVLYLY